MEPQPSPGRKGLNRPDLLGPEASGASGGSRVPSGGGVAGQPLTVPVTRAVRWDLPFLQPWWPCRVTGAGFRNSLPPAAPPLRPSRAAAQAPAFLVMPAALNIACSPAQPSGGPPVPVSC